MPTVIPDYAPKGNRPRFSKLAVAAMLVAPLPVIGLFLLAFAFLTVRAAPKQGWDGLGQIIMLGLGAQVLLIGGTICAALAIVLGSVASRRIRLRAHRLKGRRTALAAMWIGVASLVVGWGSIAMVAGIISHRQAPRSAAAEDIRTVYGAVTEYAMKHGTFPDALAQVASAKVCARYVYLGKGLPAAYRDYRTTGSQSIVVMYEAQSVDGKFTAICANAMVHYWTKPILDGALRQSDAERAMRGISSTQPTSDRATPKTQ